MWRGRGPRGDALCIIEAAAATNRACDFRNWIWSGTWSPGGAAKAGSQCMRTFLRDKAQGPWGGVVLRLPLLGLLMVHAIRLALRRVRQGHQELYEVL